MMVALGSVAAKVVWTPRMMFVDAGEGENTSYFVVDFEAGSNST